MITLTPRNVRLSPRSGVDIRRTLPHRSIRTIGAWCFVDHYGPTEQLDAMSVAAHPHAGLQTVTWLFSGEIEHCDSLGSRQVIRPGELNIMTAGHGIAHSERSLHAGADLHGIQLWVALPDAERDRSPMFHHHQDLPRFAIDGADARLFVGDYGDHRAGVAVFTPLLGMELTIPAGHTARIPLDSSFEHGLHVAAGGIRVQETSTPAGSLLFAPAGINEITVTAPEGAVIALLGGEPFTDPLVMWWNFIGRTHEEVEEMQREWNAHSDRFPTFDDAIGGRIDAPPMPNARLKARINDLI